MTAEEQATRLAEAMLDPLRQVGAMLAGEIDRLRGEVAHLKAELAETRADLRVLEREVRS